VRSYENAASKAFQAPPPAPEPAEPVNPFAGFKFSMPATPAPEPAAPAPAAAPSSSSSSDSGVGDLFKDLAKYTETPAKPAAPTPEPKKEAPKKETPKPAAAVKEAPKKPGKRRGPLPMWFAQILMLGVFGGVGLAATKYLNESEAVLKVVGEKVGQAYKAVEKLANKQAA